MATSSLKWKKKIPHQLLIIYSIFFCTNFFPSFYFFPFSFGNPQSHKNRKTHMNLLFSFLFFVFFCFFHLSQWLSFFSKPRSTKPLPFISIESTTSSSTILWSKSLTLSLTKIHAFSVKANLCESLNWQIPSIWRWKAPIQSTTWRPRSKMKKSSPNNQQRLIFTRKQSECTLADCNI